MAGEKKTEIIHLHCTQSRKSHTLDNIVEHHHGRPEIAFWQGSRDLIQSLHLALQEHRARDRQTEEEGLLSSLAGIVATEGWDIGFALQPANSPDLNTLGLGFFRAIQSLQCQKPAKNLDEMIEIVHEAYADLPLDVCKNLWTTAQLVVNQVLLCNGGNDYKFPHVGSQRP
jgi:hypothetical protein